MTEKNTLLEKLLVAHKEKEKKNYIRWDQLLKGLKTPEKRKFGLTAKSTCDEVREAIQPYLCDRFIFLKSGDSLFFAFNIPREELMNEVISEKNLPLTKILTAHYDKDKKKYLFWDQLQKNLDKDEKKRFNALFGLAAKSPLEVVKGKIEPFLGSNLMLFDHDGRLGLAFKMSPVDLRTELDSEKADYLKDLLAKYKAKEKKSYLPLKLDAAGRSMFGLDAKADAKETEKTLAPFLGDGLIFLWKKGATKAAKDILYIAANMPEEEFVTEAFQALSSKKTFAMKDVAKELPLDNDKFVALFNRMLESGRVSIVKIDEKYGIKSVQICDQGVAAPKPSPPVARQGDRELFHAAFDKLDRGRIYVRICNMRRELAWSEERFDNLLRRLRIDGTIQLHAGDVATMTEEDVNQSYTDENNFFYATLTWKKR